MRTSIAFSFFAFLIFLFLLAPVFAQTAENKENAGYLQGEIVDTRGAVIPKVSITIEAKNFKRVVLTNDEGNYKVDLPAGVYRVTAEKTAFQRFRQKKVVIEPKIESSLNINLKFGKPIIVDGEHP